MSLLSSTKRSRCIVLLSVGRHGAHRDFVSLAARDILPAPVWGIYEGKDMATSTSQVGRNVSFGLTCNHCELRSIHNPTRTLV